MEMLEQSLRFVKSLKSFKSITLTLNIYLNKTKSPNIKNLLNIKMSMNMKMFLYIKKPLNIKVSEKWILCDSTWFDFVLKNPTWILFNSLLEFFYEIFLYKLWRYRKWKKNCQGTRWNKLNRITFDQSNSDVSKFKQVTVANHWWRLWTILYSCDPCGFNADIHTW